MAETTGPILAIGGVTVLNQTVLHNRPMDWRLPIATGVACGFFALLERGAPQATRMAAYAALIAVLFTRINGVPSPTESFLSWWNAGPGK
jgi:uncharacterized membrane protein YjjP (DUF1212 family)